MAMDLPSLRALFTHRRTPRMRSLDGHSDFGPSTSGAAREHADFDEERCRALLRVLTSIVWATDAEGCCNEPQQTWSDYTGQSWNDQKGFGWLDAIHPQDRQALLDALGAARAERRDVHCSGRLWHAQSQSYRRFDAHGAPITDDSGEVREWVGTCNDVEDRQRAEDALRQADRRKDEFIAVLAHELRNPLAPIRNAVHVLKSRGSEDMQLAWARSIIERQIGQMSHLLDDLLDVSRISQNKVELKKVRTTLDSILDAAIETSRPQLEQQGHQFELNALSAPIYVEADPLRLAQVFANLLNNSAKYTEPGGRVALTVKECGGEAVVSIKDTGIGIAPETLPKLFQMFCQDAPALEKAQGGLGIGLSLVKAFVEMHAGQVEARSEGVGRGSEFIVRLPTAARRASAASVAREQLAARAGLSILVADDNRDAGETLAVLLGTAGHEVRVAADGQEAVDLALAVRPHVALLDIGMPKLNGYQAAERLRKDLPGCVLIAATGWGQRDDMRRAAAAGFEHHLVKPIDPDQLFALLAALEVSRAGAARLEQPGAAA